MQMLESDIKLLKNTLHAFLLSLNERIDTTKPIHEWVAVAKGKLDHLARKMVKDQQQIERHERSLEDIHAKWKEVLLACSVDVCKISVHIPIGISL
jgi:hypothetical protein